MVNRLLLYQLSTKVLGFWHQQTEKKLKECCGEPLNISCSPCQVTRMLEMTFEMSHQKNNSPKEDHIETHHFFKVRLALNRLILTSNCSC